VVEVVDSLVVLEPLVFLATATSVSEPLRSSSVPSPKWMDWTESFSRPVSSSETSYSHRNTTVGLVDTLAFVFSVASTEECHGNIEKTHHDMPMTRLASHFYRHTHNHTTTKYCYRHQARPNLCKPRRAWLAWLRTSSFLPLCPLERSLLGGVDGSSLWSVFSAAAFTGGPC
jgi:hypothetical protein